MAALPLVLGACVTTVPLSGPDDPSVGRLAPGGATSFPAVVVTDDSTYHHPSLAVRGGSLVLGVHRDSVSVPISSVRRVEFVNPGRGALEGIGSALVLSGIGALLGMAAGDPDGDGPESRWDRAARVGAIVGVFAVPVGFVIGLGGGHRTIYQISPPG